jgi:hypothetical protein
MCGDSEMGGCEEWGLGEEVCVSILGWGFRERWRPRGEIEGMGAREGMGLQWEGWGPEE